MRISRMFAGLKTWNPWFGCNYHCYRDGCWVKKRIAHRLGKMLNCQRCYDFIPHFHPKRLTRIPSDPRIFVVAHGDLFGWWVPKTIIRSILRRCRLTPKEIWFFETKNPAGYVWFIDEFPENTVLSATIETNKTYPEEIRGSAPTQEIRFESLYKISKQYNFPIHISIEPIMDFDMDILVSWMKQLKPVKVAVGYDSLHNRLPEPSLSKTLRLIEGLEKFTEVERKDLREKNE